MARLSKNPYDGKVKLYIDGCPAEELGADYVCAVVTDWFIRSMMKSPSAHIQYPGLSQWEYTGLDCEHFKKAQP